MGPIDYLTASEAVAAIRSTLSARSFEVLRLRLVDGRTLAEIGRRFEFSHQYAAKLVNEAIGRLRLLLS